LCLFLQSRVSDRFQRDFMEASKLRFQVNMSYHLILVNALHNQICE
jgi:hypothetical protein